MQYSIKEVSKITGLSASALRYYDKEGLLPALEKKGSGYRVFHELDLETIRVIECFKKSGMEIKDIKQYMDLFLKGDYTLQERYEMLLAQRRILERKRAEIDEALQENERLVQNCITSLEKGSEQDLRDAARKLYEEQRSETKLE
jgi:DNA-binding transcriptional MerR regulator